MPSGAADWLAENAEDRTTLGQCARDLMQASKGRLSYSQAAVCVSLHHLRTALELAAEEAHSDDVPVGASAESDAGSTPGSDLGSGAGEAAPTEGFSEKTTRPGRNEVPAAGATAVKAEDAIATAGAGAAASTAEDAEATASDGTADDGGEAGQNAASRIRVRLPDEVETGQDAPIARTLMMRCSRSARLTRRRDANVKSFEPGEDWGWCYVDEVMFEPAPRPHRSAGSR